MDEKQKIAAQNLLDAALKFWEAHPPCGVRWLLGTGGELIVFTRGEYKNQIMQNIDGLNFQPDMLYGDQMPDPYEDDP